MSLRSKYLWLAILLFAGSAAAFEYYANPYTALSQFLYPEETQVMPNGSLRTHCGILHFSFSLAEHALPTPEIRLLDDWLPAAGWALARNGVTYEWQAFATTIPKTHQLHYKASTINLFDKFEIIKMPNLFNLIQIQAENLTTKTQSAQLFLDYEIGQGFPMMVDYLSREYIYFDHRGRSFGQQEKGEWFGDKRELLLYLRPHAVAKENRMLLSQELAPGKTASWLLILPYFPAHPSELKQLRRADFSALLEEKLAFYDGLRQRIPQLELGEKKPEKLFYASLMYLLESCIDKIEDRYILRANPFQYDQFYIRDSTFMVRALDLLGLFDLAENCLQFFLESQEKNGRFASQPTQYDANGLALYALGQHLEFSRERRFAGIAFKKVQNSMQWLQEYRENRGGETWLLPASTMNDNEQVKDAHIVGHNLWALAGMHQAVHLARMADQQQAAQLWQQWFEQYRRVIQQELSQTATINGGFISPAFEGKDTPANQPGRFGLRYGFDWGNLQLLYPLPVLSSSDPVVNKSLDFWKQFINEGLFPYPEGGNEEFLHHYLTFDLMHQQLVAGRTTALLNEFYHGILYHTTAANGGCERLNAATHDFQPPTNLTPHGAFAAKYIEFLRNSLVRETEQELHFASFLSPRWTRPGNHVKLLGAPTTFGLTSFAFYFEENQGHFQLSPPPSARLTRIILHLPPWLKPTRATADGSPLSFDSLHQLVLSPSIHSLDLHWERMPAPEVFELPR